MENKKQPMEKYVRFVADYNERRAHGSLGDRTPMSVLVNNVFVNHT